MHPDSPSHEITRTLLSLRSGEDLPTLQARLFSLVYDELHAMAAGLMYAERPEHTLQPTALVNEAYLRLVNDDRVGWEARAHFFGAAARAMRQVLMEYARRRMAKKRQAGRQRITLEEEMLAGPSSEMDLVELDDLLSKLRERDERAERVVELRVFGGLNMDEIAHLIGVSKRTVAYDWSFAQKWLRLELSRG